MKATKAFLFLSLLVIIACQSSSTVQRSEEEIASFQTTVDHTLANYTRFLILTDEQQYQLRPLLEAELSWQIAMRERIREKQSDISAQELQIQSKTQNVRSKSRSLKKAIIRRSVTDIEKETAEFNQQIDIERRERADHFQGELIRILTPSQMNKYMNMLKASSSEEK